MYSSLSTVIHFFMNPGSSGLSTSTNKITNKLAETDFSITVDNGVYV